MDFLGGALPNIMFIVGIIAIGIGLGIEFKVVEIKSEISKGGRMAAFGIGIALIAASIFLYTQSRPAATSPATESVEQPASAPTEANAAVVDLAQATPVPTPPSVSTPPEMTAAATVTSPPVPTSPPVSTPPEITPAAVVTSPPAPNTDPMAELQALFAAATAEGGAGKEVKDLLKKWEEFQDALSKGDQKKAGDHLRSLQKELQEAADKGKVDPAFVEAALSSIQAVATQYGLELPAAKP
jgi:hypothetical protein